MDKGTAHRAIHPRTIRWYVSLIEAILPSIGGDPEVHDAANPDYTVFAENVHIVGNVLWTVRRV